MKNGFTDIHHHLIYGMDDGPKTYDEAQDMLLAAKNDGVTRIIVTPHVEPGVRFFDVELYFERLENLRLNSANRLEVELLPGAEIFHTQTARRMLGERRIPTLAGTEYVLVEFLPEIRYDDMLDALENLLVGGYIPVLAHVERYHCLVSKPKRAMEMKKRLDVRYQVNCSTVINSKGYSIDRFCKKLFSDGAVDAIATDAHNCSTRPTLMTSACKILEERYGVDYTEQLMGVNGGLL